MTEMDNLHGIRRNAGYLIFDMGMDLKLILLLTLVTVAFIFIPVLDRTILGSTFGIAMMLFIPGYALTAALFTNKGALDGIERAALSFGMSISVVPVTALILSISPWGLFFNPLVICLTVFTVLCALLANLRRHMLPKEDRFYVDFKKAYADMKSGIFTGGSRLDKALSVLLLCVIVMSAAMVAYMVIMPKQGETFTEFYVLGPNNTADSYPTGFNLGDSRQVVVGVANHEARDANYDLSIVLNNSTGKSTLYTGNMRLADNQTWDRRINLTPDLVGTNLKLDFLLYIDGKMDTPYRECYFWVNVTNLK